MVSTFPVNPSKLGTIIPLLHAFNLAQIFHEEFIINIDDSYVPNSHFNILKELKYWGIKPNGNNYISSLSEKSLQHFLSTFLYNSISQKKSKLVSCKCGKLELFGRDLSEGMYGKSKVEENKKCKFCKSSHTLYQNQLFATFGNPLHSSHKIYPQNMQKFYNSKYLPNTVKEFRISRARKTPYKINFQDKTYYLDPDFINILSPELLRNGKPLKIIYSQKRPEKLFLMNTLLGSNTDFIGIPYLIDFNKCYELIKAQSNNYKYLTVFIALCTSWNEQKNQCNEAILRTYSKLSNSQKDFYYKEIMASKSIDAYLKTFNNNILSFKCPEI